MEGVNAQELRTPGPEDVVQEYKPTWHWALVMHGAGHQGELEPSGGPRLLLFVEARHALLVSLRPSTEMAL